MKKLTRITKTAIDSDNPNAVMNVLLIKVNEIIDEVNRMNGFESGTVKEIDKNDLENSFGISAKDKAIQLIARFKPYMYCFRGSGMLSNDYDEDTADLNEVECALMNVEEISRSHYTNTDIWKFYSEVKKELLNKKTESKPESEKEDISPCNDKDPIKTLAAIRDRLLPLVDETSECGDMLSCTGSRTECVQGLVEQIVDQYSTLKNQNELMENAIRTFCERVEKGEVRSHKTYTNFKGILHSIKKGGSND